MSVDLTRNIVLKQGKNSIRIRHKTLRNVMMILRDTHRPLPNVHLRPICDVCTVKHTHKTYHLKLDDEGCILVSTGVYDHIAAMNDKGGFDIVNVIHNPPTQILLPDKVELDTKAFSPGRVEVKEA